MRWRSSHYGWRLLPGGLATLVFAALLPLGALQPLEQIAYNVLFRLRGAQTWDDRLVLIAIDDTSIKTIGRFPWSRQYYVKLLHALAKNEAAAPSVVVMDLLWSESSPDDTQLAQAMAAYGRVVLAQAREATNLPLPIVPTLQKAAIATGHIYKQTDADGLTRKIDLHLRDEPALGLAAVEAYALVQSPVPLPAPSTRSLWLNWAGPAQTLPQYSFADVIQGRIPKQALRNKIVLVGVTAVGFDPLVTPFDQNPPASGVYLNAVLINNLLQQNALEPFSLTWSVLILCLGGPVLSLLLSDRRESLQLGSMVGLWFGWGLISLLLFKSGYWLPVVLPFGLVTVTTIAVILSDRLRLAARLQDEVKQLWQQHQHDLVTRGTEWSAAELSHKAGWMQSVTDLALLAEQFARSQSAQAAIARSVPIGLLAADLDGKVWFCNPIASDWLQMEVGSDLSAGLVPLWFSQEQWHAELQTLRQQTPSIARECQQGDRWFELKLEPLVYQPNPGNAYPVGPYPDGCLLVLEDITPRKQVETALEQQVQELQQIAQLKDDFLSTVSHELRSPMANIKMAIELLKIARSSESSAQYLKILQAECTRETNLINDLLDLQRLEAGAQTYNPETIDLNDWLPPIIRSFSERAETQQQSLHMTLPPQLPALVSDQPSLERIVVELVNNACKYTPPNGEINVAVHLLPPYVEFVVENSGTEIPAAELPRIFEKFYRVPQGDPWKRGGTGLGLALVSKLVECLGGKISVHSGSGHTTFTVQLPLAYPHPNAV